MSSILEPMGSRANSTCSDREKSLQVCERVAASSLFLVLCTSCATLATDLDWGGPKLGFRKRTCRQCSCHQGSHEVAEGSQRKNKNDMNLGECLPYGFDNGGQQAL